MLAEPAQAVGPPKVHGVVEASVDGFGVVSPAVQLGEVRITGGNGPDVLWPVEAPSLILICPVEANSDLSWSFLLGQRVVVVPAVRPVLVADPVRPHPRQFYEQGFPVLLNPGQAHGSASRVQPDSHLPALAADHLLVLEVDALFDPATVGTPRPFGPLSAPQSLDSRG